MLSSLHSDIGATRAGQLGACLNIPGLSFVTTRTHRPPRPTCHDSFLTAPRVAPGGWGTVSTDPRVFGEEGWTGEDEPHYRDGGTASLQSWPGVPHLGGQPPAPNLCGREWEMPWGGVKVCLASAVSPLTGVLAPHPSPSSPGVSWWGCLTSPAHLFSLWNENYRTWTWAPPAITYPERPPHLIRSVFGRLSYLWGIIIFKTNLQTRKFCSWDV